LIIHLESDESLRDLPNGQCLAVAELQQGEGGGAGDARLELVEVLLKLSTHKIC